MDSAGDRGIALESFAKARTQFEPYARALDLVNKHITIRPEDIKDASAAYQELAEKLVEKLQWPSGAIRVFPQGSASTQTLIRSPDRTKFDIDAVCRVVIDAGYVSNPLTFFDDVGKGLEGLVVEAKNRCWKVNFPNRPYYIEFTPSVPLESVHIDKNGNDLRRLVAPGYIDTALAVVDRETKTWKTSNPEGLVKWVDEASKYKLVRVVMLKAALEHVMDSVRPVSEQEIAVDDTLRIAIRLFKRHRDMSVFHGHIDRQFQPISVILVTLLTQMYYGLAELGRTFENSVQLLVQLAELLPHMVPSYPTYGYFIGNPTVEGENFAERWNTDEGERAETFAKWCKLLRYDLETILSAADEKTIEEKARKVFGCTRDTGPSDGGGGGGGVSVSPTRRPPPPPRTQGLA
ncbi:hypothetical protein DA70_08765 [Pandoraea pnomenusa]|nr:hypothetical protein DA70_08765 [Pandoraea pnomenusa]